MEISVDITMDSPGVGEEKIFVAVGNVLDDRTSMILLWALKNFWRKNICIIHVHQPAQEIRDVMGARLSVEILDEKRVEAHRKKEKKEMHIILNEYLDICLRAGVSAEAIHIEMDNIERGIVELILQHGITKLVMGAAIDKSKKMIKLRSQKAKFVFEKAPTSCDIFFVCNNNLIVTRQEIIAMVATTPSPSPSPSQLPSHLDSPVSITGQVELTKSGNYGGRPFKNFFRALSWKKDMQTPRSRSKSPPRPSQLRDSIENPNDSSPANELPLAEEPESVNEKKKKGKTEKLERKRQELEKLKSQRDLLMEELRGYEEKKAKLESQFADSDRMVAESVEKQVLAAAQKLAAIRKEVEELQKLKKATEEDFASFKRPQFFSVFSAVEIESATCSFDPSMKIGEGAFGNVYEGVLRQTPVAIKRFHSHCFEGQSSSDFGREVDVLSKVRHQNIVTLIGACPEGSSVVFEYLANGSLEDRLSCKDGTPPLSWKTRMRIAKEICSALIFLHSNKPESIVHADIKPSNVFLDVNFVSKLGDFGIANFIAPNENSTHTATLYCISDPMGTITYVDPEYLVTGVLTTKADVYSFGVILLRLLTGRPAAMGLAMKVQSALDQGTLNDMLDASAGDWPLVQAEQLIQMALRCCEMNRKDRPNLALEVSKLFLSLDIET